MTQHHQNHQNQTKKNQNPYTEKQNKKKNPIPPPLTSSPKPTDPIT